MKTLKRMLIASILNLLALFLVTLTLPDAVPIRLNTAGIAELYGTKWIIPLIGCIPPAMISLGLVMLRCGLSQEECPSFETPKIETVFHILFSVFVMAATWLTVILALKGTHASAFPYELLVMLPLGVLLVFIGNYLSDIKQNTRFGIRTPWTLKSETVWEETHKKSSRLVASGGVLLLASALLDFFVRNSMYAVIGILLAVGLGTLLPYLYSYAVYLKWKRKE